MRLGLRLINTEVVQAVKSRDQEESGSQHFSEMMAAFHSGAAEEFRELEVWGWCRGDAGGGGGGVSDGGMSGGQLRGRKGSVTRGRRRHGTQPVAPERLLASRTPAPHCNHLTHPFQQPPTRPQ